MSRVLFGSSLKMVIRDHQAIFWALAFPVIFLGVFRLFSADATSKTSLIISVDATTERGQTLLLALDKVEFLEPEIRPGLDEAAARLLLEDGEADAALIVQPTAPDVPANAVLLVAIGDPIGRQVATAAIRSVVDQVNIVLMRAPTQIALTARNIEEEPTTFFQFVGPGIIGMGLMNFATISLAASLSRYREEGVLRRIRATPLSPSSFVTSVLAAHIAVAVAQVAILMLLAQMLGANVFRGGIWFPLTAVVGTVIFLNIGIMVAGRVRGRGAVEGAANAITLPMMFLSGSFFPVESLPVAVQKFVEVLPLTHVLRVMRGVTLDGDTITEQWPSLVVILGWLVLSTILARVAFRFDDA